MRTRGACSDDLITFASRSLATSGFAVQHSV